PPRPRHVPLLPSPRRTQANPILIARQPVRSNLRRNFSLRLKQLLVEVCQRQSIGWSVFATKNRLRPARGENRDSPPADKLPTAVRRDCQSSEEHRNPA